MRVVQINRDIGTGSVGKIVESLYWGIKKGGGECLVCYAGNNYSTIPETDTLRFGNKVDIIIHAGLAKITDKTGYYSTIVTKGLIKKIREYEPNIVHIHAGYGYYLNIRRLYGFLEKQNCKVILTLHSCWEFTGHCCHFMYSNCKKWRTGCYKCVEKGSYPESFIFDNSRRNYLLKKKTIGSLKNLIIVAPSEWMKKEAQQSFLRDCPVFVVNNGINLIMFKPTKIEGDLFGLDIRKKIILGVASRWSKRKGIDDFIKLSQTMPDDYQIALVGGNLKTLKCTSHKIICIDRTENVKQLSQLYTISTILFNPTYEDNYPTVNLEAIACGTPVITYNTGGSGEIVNELGVGRVIDKGNISDVVYYANYYYCNPIDEVTVLKCRERLSEERMVRKYVRLYDKTK